MVSITQLAHDIVRSVLQPGEPAVDGTAGNGHDTLFLSQLTGPYGKVWAFDIQQSALTSTQRRLDQHGCCNTHLILGSHAEMESLLPITVPGSVAAIMFNLGYLPHHDHALTTRKESTLLAIQAAVRCLRKDGVLTVVTYRGHPGGEEEALAVDQWMTDYALRTGGPFRFPAISPTRGPQLLAIRASCTGLSTFFN